MAKPPMVLIPLLSITLTLTYSHRLRSERAKILASFLPPFLLFLMWFFSLNPQAQEQAFRNQTISPFSELRDFFSLRFKWLRSILVDYAPLIWIACYLYFKKIEKLDLEKISAINLFLIFWILSALPIIIFIEPLSRYLFVPALGLVVLTAPKVEMVLGEERIKKCMAFAFYGSFLLWIFLWENLMTFLNLEFKTIFSLASH